MSAIADINSVSSEIVGTFGEEATYTDKQGVSTFLNVVRFDPYQRQDMVGDSLASTDPSVWVLLEDLPNPDRGDLIEVGSKTYIVRDIELHELRGYARLHVQE